MIVATAAYSTTTQFVSITRPVSMPAQKSFLIMFLTSLYLSKTFALAVDYVLSTLIDVA